jgi:hypothetical protein
MANKSDILGSKTTNLHVKKGADTREAVAAGDYLSHEVVATLLRNFIDKNFL